MESGAGSVAVSRRFTGAGSGGITAMSGEDATDNRTAEHADAKNYFAAEKRWLPMASPL